MGALNFEHVMKFVDGIVAVSEDEILSAMRVMLAATKLVPEPSGAVALAAALYHAGELPRVREVAVILSGGNLEPEMRAQLEAI
jgi:threonine dehydratase